MSDDKRLKQAVLDELQWEPSVNAAHIGVTAKDGVVTLMGHVENFAEKSAAERAARRVKEVRAVAEEIVQEVFVRLWNQPERFDPERGSLRSFLLAQTHGRSVDVLRSDGARKEREARDARSAAEAGYDLEHEVWDLAVADRVREAVLTLPEDERRAIELAYFGGRTYREVAALLGAPEGTVKSRIRSGLKRLRASLVDTTVGAAWGD